MYRTDKAFMKNPATASSRIYIGNLAETVVPDNLEEKFSAYGQIMGLVLQRGFGFIQFENDEQAQAAIANEHGTKFHNKKINVKQAIDNTKGKNNQQQQQQQQQQQKFNQKGNNQNQKNQQPPSLMNMDVSKPPANENAQRPPANELPMHGGNGPQMHGGNGPQMHGGNGPNSQQPQGNQGGNNNMNAMKKMDDGPPPPKKRMMNMGNKGGPPPMQNQQRMLPKRDFRDDMPPFFEPPPFNYHPPVIDRPDRNDCEIIVVSKGLTEYAEYIEQRLKSLGLIVDLLFPNEDVPIGRVLANISSRGCLFAILIMPQNEEHRSLTLNVLHGVPEEHRNMPIDDACLLITRNFETYMRGDKNTTGDPDKMTLTMRHPEHIQVILNLLAENRQITSGQYDKLITYIQEKRDLQGQFEINEGIDTGVEPEVKNKQAELQNRIMSILNKKPEEIPKVAEESKPGSEQTPILNDPTVQKALDSLMLGDMFKNMK